MVVPNDWDDTILCYSSYANNVTPYATAIKMFKDLTDLIDEDTNSVRMIFDKLLEKFLAEPVKPQINYTTGEKTILLNANTA